MTSELLVRGARFDVERVTLSGRDGESYTREVVRHPGAVTVLPVRDDGRLVMIRNARFTVDETLWEFPAGTREADEEPRETAFRELEEEAGYTAGRLEEMPGFYLAPGTTDEFMWVFVATGLRERTQRLDATEEITVTSVTKERFLEMVRAGDIRDAKTLAVGLSYLMLHETVGARGR